ELDHRRRPDPRDPHARGRAPQGPQAAGRRPPGAARLADRHPVRHPGAVDGADVVPQRRGRRDQPALDPRATDHRRLPGVLRRRYRRQSLAVPAQLAHGERGLHGDRAAPGDPRCLRAVDQAGAQVDRRDVLLPVHPDAADRGRAAADLPVRAVHRPAGQHLAAHRPVHGHEPADRGVDDAVVPGRGPRGDPRGGVDGRRRPAAHPPPGGGAHRPARHRGDVADLLHLQLERAAAGTDAHRHRGADGTGLPDRVRDQSGTLPGTGLRGRLRGVPAGAHRRLRRPGQAGAGPVAGGGQV
ncbi:MAG: Various polyols ABC transporter, permease protein 2, partial [uncultured Blastococcus sp.]